MARELRKIPTDGLSIRACNALMADVSSNHFVDIGDVEAATLAIEVEEISRKGRNSATRYTRASDVVEVNATLTMTILDLSKFWRALSVGADTGTKYTQAEATAATFAVDGVKPGIYKLPHLRVSNVSVADEATPFVQGIHYVVLEDTGYVQVLTVPAGATGMEVTYDAAAVVAGDEVVRAGVGSNFDIHKTIHLVGINPRGPRDLLILHDVRLRIDGDVAFQGGDDYAQLEITGTVLADPSRDTEFALGELWTID